MGTSQSTELKDGANVKDIIGSENHYSVFDLSSWQGSSFATLMLLLTLVVGGLLFSCWKYHLLRKKLAVTRKDIDVGQRRKYVLVTDLTHAILFPPYNTRCNQFSFTEPQNCTLGKSVQHALLSKFIDSIHLALERAKRSADMQKDEEDVNNCK